MIKRLILLAFILLTSSHSVFAVPAESIAPVYLGDYDDKHIGKYPEDKIFHDGEARRRVDIYTVKSPLEYTTEEAELITRTKEFFKGGYPEEAEEVVTAVGFNKFTLGTGVLNVTYQVRKGVKYALKDTLQGYPEYQRRRAVEETINSNLAARKKTREFLTGSSDKEEGFFNDLLSLLDLPFGIHDFVFRRNNKILGANILMTAYAISTKKLIKKLHGLFERLSYILLVLLTSLTIFRRLTEGDFAYACGEPMLNALYSAFLIGFSSFLLKWVLKIMIVIQGLSNDMIMEFFKHEDRRKALAMTWENFANDVGYMPAQILSYIDILAQIFVYFFVAGLILHIIIGIIISPIWALAFVSNSLRSSSYNSFINWTKTVTVTALIPVVYIVIKCISQEFNIYGYDFLEIVISIARYLYLPAIANIILAKSSGIIQPAFSGYQIVADSINNSYNGIKSSIETYRKA